MHDNGKLSGGQVAAYVATLALTGILYVAMCSLFGWSNIPRASAGLSSADMLAIMGHVLLLIACLLAAIILEFGTARLARAALDALNT